MVLRIVLFPAIASRWWRRGQLKCHRVCLHIARRLQGGWVIVLIDPSVSLSIESVNFILGVTSRMSLVRENVLSAVLDDIVTVVRAVACVGGCG